MKSKALRKILTKSRSRDQQGGRERKRVSSNDLTYEPLPCPSSFASGRTSVFQPSPGQFSATQLPWPTTVHLPPSSGQRGKAHSTPSWVLSGLAAARASVSAEVQLDAPALVYAGGQRDAPAPIPAEGRTETPAPAPSSASAISEVTVEVQTSVPAEVQPDAPAFV
ncbi:hypothetical protein ATANTOWER_031086 [Ataeniobius toweri]|uniref:Uncharacterized protein n=1 Tax=Ataeniobius toweri TaxID=208326 RepID=A0ABU7AHI5_9TELE|nr:hypothetical protein [Ataeniobius toweri]